MTITHINLDIIKMEDFKRFLNKIKQSNLNRHSSTDKKELHLYRENYKK